MLFKLPRPRGQVLVGLLGKFKLECVEVVRYQWMRFKGSLGIRWNSAVMLWIFERATCRVDSKPA
eukprot:9812441-Alexandrium_andersonii.AAC.1